MHLADIIKQCTDGADHCCFLLKVGGQTVTKAAFHKIGGGTERKALALACREHGTDAIGDKLGDHRALRARQVYHDLARLIGSDLTFKA